MIPLNRISENPVLCHRRHNKFLKDIRSIREKFHEDPLPELLRLKFHKEKSLYSFESVDSVYAPILVGTGEPQEGCGSSYKMVVCERCYTPFKKLFHCNRKECPVCWTSWKAQEVDRIENRILSKGAFELNKGYKLSHFVLSPPPSSSIHTINDLNKLIRLGYSLLSKKGVKGGVLIHHPFRVTSYGKRLFAKSSFPKDKKKIWAFIHSLNLNTPQLLDKGIIYPSSHFHLIAYSRWTKKGDNSNGWVFKFLWNLNKSDHGRFIKWEKIKENVRKVSHYLLSHTGTLDNSTSVRWFGNCSVSSLPVTPLPPLSITCPLCGGKLLGEYATQQKLLFDKNWNPPPDKEKLITKALFESDYSSLPELPPLKKRNSSSKIEKWEK